MSRRWLMLLLALAAPLGAQADSSMHQRSLFTWRDGVLAAGFVVATVSIRPLDKTAAAALQSPLRQKNRILRDAAIGFNHIAIPGSTIIGVSMYAAGRLTKDDRLAELGLHGTEALFVGAGIGEVLKYTFGRARPFVDSTPNPDNWQLFRGLSRGSEYQSFPSGHTVAGFAAAAAVASTTSTWWPGAVWFVGPAMYGGAALIGLSRMYDNRHWASDVIVGAAIGTFAGTKVVRYHRTHPDNRLDKWLLSASASPGDLSHITFSLIPLLR